jgi:hypothetical protein
MRDTRGYWTASIRLVDEARLEDAGSGLAPVTESWFVVNVRDAEWFSSETRGGDRREVPARAAAVLVTPALGLVPLAVPSGVISELNVILDVVVASGERRRLGRRRLTRFRMSPEG